MPLGYSSESLQGRAEKTIRDPLVKGVDPAKSAPMPSGSPLTVLGSKEAGGREALGSNLGALGVGERPESKELVTYSPAWTGISPSVEASEELSLAPACRASVLTPKPGGQTGWRARGARS